MMNATRCNYMGGDLTVMCTCTYMLHAILAVLTGMDGKAQVNCIKIQLDVMGVNMFVETWVCLL